MPPIMPYTSLDQLRMYLPQVAEYGIQRITFTGDPSGGTFALDYEGAPTIALPYNATAAAVQTALRDISAIGTNVRITGMPGSPYIASFSGALATDAAPLTAVNNLTGAPTPGITIEPWTDAILTLCLEHATAIVRATLRSMLADKTFDYADYDVPATKILMAYASMYLPLPAYQTGTVTLVEYQSGSAPSTWAPLASNEWEEVDHGMLYRAAGWATIGQYPRYRVTAVWGYGPDVPDSIQQVVAELAVTIWRTRDRGGFTETVGVEGAGASQHVSGLTKLQRQILLAERDTLIRLGV